MNVINWSGGHDSTVMLHYLLHNTELEPFRVMFVDSTIIVPETLEYMKEIVELFGIKKEFVLLHPKETFYERMLRYRFWPAIKALWCRKILKLDPIRDFYNNLEQYCIPGDEPLAEFIGISIHDSAPRKRIYRQPNRIRRWGRKFVECVYPLLKWTDEKKKRYMKENRIPLNPVYDTFGLSGCYFCPYYHEPDYLRLRRFHPELFNKLLECEEQIGKRALPDFWLRDLARGNLFSNRD